MTVCIVTVYNSENCGSFLQAFALYDYLKEAGHKVYFFKRDTKGTSHSLKPHFEESIKRILKLKFKALIAEWQRYASFSAAQKIFPAISRDSAEYKSVDCFVIGSDTIWNLDNRYFRQAYIKLIKTIQAKYSGVSIICVVGDKLGDGYASSVETIAGHFGIPCVSFSGDSDNIPKVSGSHPTAAGFDYMARKIYSEAGEYLQ